MNTRSIADCMVTDVATCRPETSTDQAARLMWERDCGVLPVVGEDGRVLGVVTDRDLTMAAYTRGRALHDLHVGECMSGEPHTCSATDSLEDALRSLGRHRVHRLPVVDSDGRLAGIVALNDLVRCIDASADQGSQRRLAKLLVSSLASICAPRPQGAPRSGARAGQRRRPQGALAEG